MRSGEVSQLVMDPKVTWLEVNKAHELWWEMVRCHQQE